jgi:hypothetical protein
MKDFEYIKINQEQTTYRIYNNGKVMNEKTGNCYKGTIRNGYRWFDLRWKNKKYSFSQHRLLAEYFIPNPNKLEYVHHINGNRLDNKISNLKWVTPSENNLKKNKTIIAIDHNDYNCYNGLEEWKTFRNTRYMVSNWGRVKNAETDKILKGKITDNGYRSYCLTIDSKKKSYFGHRLTYEVWKNSDMKIINHIDGNKLNNRIENLESITNQENNLKAIYETKTHKFKKTAQYDLEGNLIQIFENNAAAARAMNVRPQSIQAAISKGYKSCGYIWKNLE